MSEQQRIFVAVALCLGIMLLWPYLMPEKQPPPKPATAAATAAPATTPAEVVEPSSPTGAEPSEAGTPPPVTPAVAETAVPFSTPLLRGSLSNIDASLTSLELTTYNEQLVEEEGGPKGKRDLLPVSLATAKVGGVSRQARITWNLGKKETAANLAWESQTDGLVLRGVNEHGIETRVEMKPRQDAWALDYVMQIKNNTDHAIPAGATVTLLLDPGPKRKSSWFAPPVNLVNGVCALADGEIERRLDSDLAEDGAWSSTTNAGWVAIDRQYFVIGLAPQGAAAGTCRMAVDDRVLSVAYAFNEAALAPGGTWEGRFSLFLGPKRDDALAAVSPALKEVIDYVILGIPLGFLSRPMVVLLSLFHGWSGSWGIAIMLLTLLVKLVLFPVTYKSSLSMRRMQLLKPELDRLKKQYANDRERHQIEQMKLFKEKGVNPLGGCIPMLLQMPVWFALYRTLWTAVDLYQQQFLWLPDLTAKEPFPFMALAVGGLTFLQQKLMPTTMDSQQAKMMLYFMPVMITVFMVALPSGLVLYILFNSILTLIQQLVINKRLTHLG